MQTYQPEDRKKREGKGQGAEKLNYCERKRVESETSGTGSMGVKRYFQVLVCPSRVMKS